MTQVEEVLHDFEKANVGRDSDTVRVMLHVSLLQIGLIFVAEDRRAS
jgi:hypothetical protein